MPSSHNLTEEKKLMSSDLTLDPDLDFLELGVQLSTGQLPVPRRSKVFKDKGFRTVNIFCCINSMVQIVF